MTNRETIKSMRKLKFRVWSKTSEKFFTTDEWFFDFDGHLYFLDIVENDMIRVPDNEYLVQQYTGLKDKNNVEIYEGDILSIYNHPLAEQVEYELDGSSFGFFAHDDVDRQHGTWEYLSDWTSAAGYDVIGNIFENSELLEA
jgi:uncharacterized phage protein (TIGR01671 family)